MHIRRINVGTRPLATGRPPINILNQ